MFEPGSREINKFIIRLTTPVYTDGTILEPSLTSRTRSCITDMKFPAFSSSAKTSTGRAKSLGLFLLSFSQNNYINTCLTYYTGRRFSSQLILVLLFLSVVCLSFYLFLHIQVVCAKIKKKKKKNHIILGKKSTVSYHLCSNASCKGKNLLLKIFKQKTL